MSPIPPDPDARSAFQSTRWSLVLQAKDKQSNESREAMEQLCRTYWYPLYAYVRRQGVDAEEAMDITQGFFARLLEKSSIDAADPERGRFRAFMLASIKNYLHNEWRSQKMVRRGGRVHVVSLSDEDFESRYQDHLGRADAECQFDRDWADALLDHAIERLRSDYEAAGRSMLFELLLPFLVADGERLPHAEISTQTGLNKSAVKMSIHRMRKQYAKYVRSEISETLGSPDDVEDELSKLIALVR